MPTFAATAIDVRAAAALALAQAESALKFPPVWKISECVVEPAKPAGLRPWIMRALGSFAAALAIVLALEGWSHVRAASRTAR